MCVCVRELNGEQKETSSQQRKYRIYVFVYVNQGMHNLSLRCENTCVKKKFLRPRL